MARRYVILSFIVLLVSILLLSNLVSSLTATLGNSRIILHMKVGESAERDVLIKNVNSVPVKIEITASGDLGDSIIIKDNLFTLSPNEEKKAFFTIRATKSGTTETRLNVRFIPEDGNAVGASATVVVIASGSDAGQNSPDIAYILKDPTKADSALLEQIKRSGFTSEIISENKIKITDFSKYRLVIVGDQDLDNPEIIPFDKYRSIIINSHNYASVSGNSGFGWSANFGSKSSPGALSVLNLNSPITFGLRTKFNAYSAAEPKVKVSYLKGKKAAGINIIATTGIDAEAVVASVEKGAKFLNDKTARERSVFFGITQAQYWTADVQKMFNNSLYWALYGEDRDKDGFFSDVDCRDNDEKVYPGAEEIPYDGIDQNCDGRDLVDVDEDNFASLRVGGEDCDDENSTINPENTNPLLNCINDAPIMESIPDIFGKENDKIVFTVIASDPENDNLTFSINDSNFIAENNEFAWQTSYDSSGVHYKTITVSDGKNRSTQEVKIIIENANRLPRFVGLPLISFDEDSLFILDLSSFFFDDDRDDTISYSVEQYPDVRKINISVIDRNNLLLKPTPDWNGGETIILSASDEESKFISPRIRIMVNPLNDLPQFNGEIENIAMDEDSVLKEFLDLKKYFSDPDSNLIFSVFGNESIEITISERGLVSFFPKKDWNGEETIVFSAKDEYSNIISNQIKATINPKDEIPVLSLANCLTSINEEEIYECEISTSDLENDPVNLKVIAGNKLYCKIEGNRITYSAYRDYNGKANCKIEISDKDGSNEYILEVDVIQVNDAPVITEFLELNQVIIPEGATQSFFLSLYDPDSIPVIEWFLDNDKIKSESALKSSYNYAGQIGEHTIKAIITDSQFEETKIWNVNVIKKGSLDNSQVLDYIEPSDTEKNDSYNLTSVDSCLKKNNSLEIKIKDPDIDDEFNPGDVIEGEIELINKLDKKQSLRIKAYLYDLDERDVIDSNSFSLSVDKNDKEAEIFKLEAPEDIDLEHRHIIYVKAEDEICNEIIQDVNIERPEHSLIIKSLDIPEELKCGVDAEINAKIKNLGENEESAILTIENADLNIKMSTEQFPLEENGERDSATQRILIHIPENAEGDFILKTTLDYGIDQVIAENNLRIKCDDEQSYYPSELDIYSNEEDVESINLEESIVLKEQKAYQSNSVLSKSTMGFSEFLAIILSILNIFFIAGILYMAKWLRI